MYVHGTLFLTFVITIASSDQFGTQPFAKMFLYFDVLTWLPALNLWSLSVTFLLELMYVFDVTSTGFISVVLWNLLLHLLTISSNLSMYKLFDIESIYKFYFIKF